MMTIKVGDEVAYCYHGSHESRRIRNMFVTKVMKTFIETNDGSRFSSRDLRQTMFFDGKKEIKNHHMKNYYIDPQISYWDGKDERDNAIREINTGFENLLSAARDRNWEMVKDCYKKLYTLIGE